MRERGFTLIEVVIALAILALSLGVLLETQISSLDAAGRARDLTIASMLARSKMIDVEQQLFDDGFTVGDSEEQGDFGDEGHPEYKWTYKVSEVELDIGTLDSLCGGDEDSGDTAGAAGACSGMVKSFGGAFESFVNQVSQSVRAVALTVSWPPGRPGDKMEVRALMTREDLATSQSNSPLGGAATTDQNGNPIQGAPGTGGGIGGGVGGGSGSGIGGSSGGNSNSSSPGKGGVKSAPRGGKR